MGFGSKNIIADEASLIEDPLWSTVMRMLGGDLKESDARKLLIKIGNPFFRNHFYQSSKDARYHQIFHNWKDSVRDYEDGFYGYKPEYIEEMRGQAFFDVFYECLFPDEEMIDARGYRRLLQDNEIKIESQTPYGTPILGCDIGGGGDLNVFTMRWPNVARVVRVNQNKDTMTNVTTIRELKEEYPELRYEDVNVDDVGIGRGVRDRCWELGMPVNGVSSGDKSTQPDKYSNLNMEMSWEMACWLQTHGVLEPYIHQQKNVWEQLTWYKYKVNTDKQMKMEPKDELKKRTGKSPDFGDSLRLTFYQPPQFGVITF
jgi:hypothetical protein